MMPGLEVPECNKTLNRYFLVNSSEEWLWLLTSWNSCHATKVSTVPLGDHHKQSQKGFTFYNDIKNSWGCSKCFTFAKDLLITFFFWRGKHKKSMADCRNSVFSTLSTAPCAFLQYQPSKSQKHIDHRTHSN